MRIYAVLMTAALTLSAAENPLLKLGYRIPFDQIKPEHVAPAVTQLLAEAEKDRDALKNSKGPRTWANTMDPLDNLGSHLEDSFGVVRILESVASTPELRKAFNEANPKVSTFFSSLSLDSDLAAKVREYSETAEAKSLTGAKARDLKLTLDTFRRNGAYLDETKRKRLQAINTELAELTAKFGQNVLDATNQFELIVTDPKQIAGLPESAKQAAAASAKAKKKEGWRFTLQAPSFLAVQKFMDDASIREKLYRAQITLNTSGATDNRPLMKQILELRREQAALLNFATFADLQLEDRMAKSGANVKKFLGDLDDQSRPAFDKENAELQAFRKSLEGENAPALQAWDVAYYAEKMRQKLYAFDEESLRPYFALDSVFEGMFGLVNKLYGIQVKPAENKATWDPAVKFYEIRDADNTLLGSFYADFYPRENKRPGAWMNPILYGGPNGSKFNPHLGMICGNLTPPVDGKPALITHREVETVFHEFGHLLHLSLSRSPIRPLGGTNVAWDFVELPSQFMENFTWERPVVDLFAKQYQTGEKLPEDLFQKMIKAKNFRSANAMMGQLGFGMQDILLHTDYKGNDQQGDVTTFSYKVAEKYSPTPLPTDYARIAAFAHIFAGGYAAGYYSYKWSEVLDADAFTRFKKEGVFNSKTGNAFRRTILEKGNTEDPAKLFRDFMGRDPDVKSLLKRSGLDFNQNMK